jgi:hypothetical protein
VRRDGALEVDKVMMRGVRGQTPLRLTETSYVEEMLPSRVDVGRRVKGVCYGAR